MYSKNIHFSVNNIENVCKKKGRKHKMAQFVLKCGLINRREKLNINYDFEIEAMDMTVLKTSLMKRSQFPQLKPQSRLLST